MRGTPTTFYSSLHSVHDLNGFLMPKPTWNVWTIVLMKTLFKLLPLNKAAQLDLPIKSKAA